MGQTEVKQNEQVGRALNDSQCGFARMADSYTWRHGHPLPLTCPFDSPDSRASRRVDSPSPRSGC